MKHLFYFMLLVFSVQLKSQERNACLEEVMQYEIRNQVSDSMMAEKNILFSYTVKVTDWENESTISNVKVYMRGKDMRFFSEQVNMYTNEKEMLVEMPAQRVIAVNNALPQTKKSGAFFQQLRREFLDSCEVVRCESSGATSKRLVLKAPAGKNVMQTEIAGIRYEYDTEQKKILSVEITYNGNYKLKSMLVIFHDFTTESDYKFTSFNSKFFDKKGQLTGKYKDYELVDSRDKKTGKSKSR